MWTATKVLYSIYMERSFNKKQVWINLLKEIEWNINMQIKIGGADEFNKIKKMYTSQKIGLG